MDKLDAIRELNYLYLSVRLMRDRVSKLICGDDEIENLDYHLHEKLQTIMYELRITAGNIAIVKAELETNQQTSQQTNKKGSSK